MEHAFQFVATACGLGMVMLGGLTLLNNRHKKSHLYFFICTMACIGWMVTLSTGFSFTAWGQTTTASLWFRIAHGCAVVVISCIAAFMVNYPTPLRIPRWLKMSFILISATLTIVASVTPHVYTEVLIFADGSLGDTFGPLYGTFIVYMLLTEAACIFFTAKRLQTAKGLTRRKIQYTFFGFLAFASATLITNAILPLFEIIVLQREAVLFSLLFLIPTFSSLYSNRFFNWSYSALNISRHFLLILAFLSIAGASYGMLSGILGTQQPMLSYVLSASIGLCGYLFLSKRYPELISEEYQHFREAIVSVRKKAYLAQNLIAFQELLHEIFMKRLGISQVSLYRIGKNSQKSIIKGFNKRRFIRFLQQKRIPILVKDELSFSAENTQWLDTMQDLDAEIILPLYVEDEVLGFLSLGTLPRSNYGKEQITLIEESQQTLETAFLNVLLKEGLHREKSVLEKTIAERTQRLRDEFNRTKNLLKKQKDYLSYAAHEIKNPLAALLIQLETSLEKRHDHQTLEDLKLMEASAKQIKKLNNNIFQARQYELKKIGLTRRNLDIGTCLEKLHQQLKPLVKKHQITFSFSNTISGNRSLYGDEEKITQVIQNLMNNAIKFTPAGGSISLGLHESPLWIHITVSDTGPGIPLEDRQKVFEKYHHGTAKNGLGIGLYLSKKIIQLHGGKIEIKDNPKGGTMVIIRLRKDLNTSMLQRRGASHELPKRPQ